MCPPSGIRIDLTIVALKGWSRCKADAESAFLQTGSAQRDVYVIPPKEGTDRTVHWLLLTAAYGLVNANGKWQHQSDATLKEHGLKKVAVIPHLFYMCSGNKLSILIAEIVDDVLLTGEILEQKSL